MIGEEVSGSFKVYHFDYRGSTVAITDSNCNITDTFTYDTYGKLTARTGTTKTPFLYNGRDGVMYEDDTGLIYMRARYYCPEIRRFVNADKVHGDISNGLTLNRYAFVNGNPANGVDPMGLSAERVGVGTAWGGTVGKSIIFSTKKNQSTKNNKEIFYAYGKVIELVLDDNFRGSLKDSLVDITINSRPPKGYNTRKWNAKKKSDLDDIESLFGESSHLAKAGKVLEWSGYAIDTYNIIKTDIYDNINNGEYDYREIATDVTIDTGINVTGYAITAGSAKLGSLIGFAICPVGGQIVGAFLGLVAGVVYNVIIDESNVRDKLDDLLEFD